MSGLAPRLPTVAFDDACAPVGVALEGDFRQRVVAELTRGTDLPGALGRLRTAMRANAFVAGRQRVRCARFVSEYDRMTQADALHALHDWDGTIGQFNAETIPVDVVTYLIERSSGEAVDATALAILLDYYFIYVLALLALRAGDGPDPDSNLDRINALLEQLHGAGGSGQRFAANAGTLVLIATSHFEPDERGYARLLERTQGLAVRHRLDMARAHAAAMGSHLRFGFEVTYDRDAARMRDDNVADYPWLRWSLEVLIGEYRRLRDAAIVGLERDRVAEAIINGVSADPAAFIDVPGLRSVRSDLVVDARRLTPSAGTYSPFGLFFNFCQNVLKGTVVDALLWGEPWLVSLDDLLTGLPSDGVIAEAKPRLAKTLMAHARAHPDTIRGRATPVIVYDPAGGRRVFRRAMAALSDRKS